LVGDAVRLLFMNVAGLADRQFRLQTYGVFLAAMRTLTAGNSVITTGAFAPQHTAEGRS